MQALRKKSISNTPANKRLAAEKSITEFHEKRARVLCAASKTLDRYATMLHKISGELYRLNVRLGADYGQPFLDSDHDQSDEIEEARRRIRPVFEALSNAANDLVLEADAHRKLARQSGAQKAVLNA
ncbi:MAG: hypothetical protein HYX72_10440 [Acidobacteria bacterium]|nr:hypothetical protein [Acidobacteriota bacterium]